MWILKIFKHVKLIKVLIFNFRDEFETVIHSDDAFAPVGYLNFKKLFLVDKTVSAIKNDLKRETNF